jgi:2-dehydropantoate 2-reductase
MHIHVLGLGAIGGLLAHNLRRVLPSQHSITIIHKKLQDVQQFTENGRSIRVERSGLAATSKGFLDEVYDRRSKPPHSQQQEQELERETSHIESIFVALKAHHIVKALKVLGPRLNANSTIVLLNNGMGVHDQLLTDVFRNPTQCPHFILASNTHGAFVKNFYHIIHAGMGSIEFGIAPDIRGRDYEAGLHDQTLPPQDRRLRLSDVSPPGDPDARRFKSLRETIAALLLLEDLNVSWKTVGEMHLILRRKLAVNAVLNPLTSILGCRNGDLFQHPFAVDILDKVCSEASMVYDAQARVDHDAWMRGPENRGLNPDGVQPPILPEPLTAESLKKEVHRVADLTKGNISSMLQDVRRGKKTEIDYINGYLEKSGREHGVETPVNSTLLNLVKLKYVMPLDQFM